MTTDSEVRKAIEHFFRGAFADALLLEASDAAPGVAIVDFMQFVKHIPAEGITLLGQLLTYFVKRGYEMMIQHPSIHTLIILVDGEPLDAKRAVAHKKRHSAVAPLPVDGGPYLPRREQDLVMDQERWAAFSRSHLLLRRELYPLLFNAFMGLRSIELPVGKRIVLSGFPGRTQWRAVHAASPWEAPRNDHNQERVVAVWQPEELPITEAMERADPELYHRAYVVEQRPNGPVHYEWERGKCSLSEGDVRMFWFAHYYDRQHVLLNINDGDVFSIGLLYAQERLQAIAPVERTYIYANRHTVVLPNKRKNEVARYTYCNLNKLYALVREHPPMREAGVQNPVATLVALITMTGTDFCEKHLHDMGFKSTVWSVFFSNIALLTHMVMMSEALPGNTRRRRDVVMDEDAFAQFVRLCYTSKYAKDLKKLKRQPSEKDLRERARKLADGRPRNDPRFDLPPANRVRAYGRASLWVLDYWKNAPLTGHAPDCFEMWDGLPYYPYWRNPGTQKPEFAALVAPRPKPVDEVYTRHKRRRTDVEVCAAHQFSRDYLAADEDADHPTRPLSPREPSEDLYLQ